MKFRILFSLLLAFLFHTDLFAQQFSFTDARKLTLVGKANTDTNLCPRVDTMKYNKMLATVKYLFTHTAGMALLFKTNSNSIVARWKLTREKTYVNMTPITHSGLDLYIRVKGVWTYAGTGAPKALASEATLVKEMESGEKECLLYLPLYNGIEHIEIGVSTGSYLTPLDNPFRGKVAVYGSSITQGASASRPGLAYLSQLTRMCNINFINLGLSGNEKMEAPVADMVADIDADVYVLDCAANPSDAEITERTAAFVQKIRSRHADAPIIMIECVERELGTFNVKTREMVAAHNRAFKEEYEQLKKAGVKNLYLIESINFLGSDHEGTADGTHPNDVGFARFIEVIKPQLLAVIGPVLKKKK